MKRYRATKILIPKNANYPSADSNEEYRDRIFSLACLSPPIDYWVEGIILNGPVVGEAFIMARDTSNGEKVEGIFCTSRVVEVKEEVGIVLFRTHNSIYQLEEAENG